APRDRHPRGREDQRRRAEKPRACCRHVERGPDPRLIRSLSGALLGVAFACVAGARPATWQPSQGHTQLPLWPGEPPHARTPAGPETVTMTGSDHLVAGHPWNYISDVSQPTITVYAPAANKTGAAVLVFPGGGY